MWKQADDYDDEEDGDDDGDVYTAEDLENGAKRERPATRERADEGRRGERGGRGGGRGKNSGVRVGGNRVNQDGSVIPEGNYYKKPKGTQRPNAQKFSEIMKADDAFPALDNQYDDEVSGGEMPDGEIEPESND